MQESRGDWGQGDPEEEKEEVESAPCGRGAPLPPAQERGEHMHRDLDPSGEGQGAERNSCLMACIRRKKKSNREFYSE